MILFLLTAFLMGLNRIALEFQLIKEFGRDDHNNHFQRACPIQRKDTRNEVRLTAVCNNIDCGLFKDGALKKDRE